MRILLVVVVGVLLGSAGCKKPASSTVASKTESTPAPAGNRGNTNYVPGGGAVQNTRQAARRVVALNDMSQIALTIASWELDNNRMPNKNEIYAALSGYPNLKKLIDDGDVILTGTTKREGLWAYEVEADTKGGIGLVSGTASRYSADDIKQMLGQ
jgi:hypothetical protein